jgi:hypothetical protein
MVIDGSTDFFILLGDYLDAFYKAGKAEKERMISLPMFPGLGTFPREYQSYFAAAAHLLANENKIKAPAWVFNKKYILSTPYFTGNAKGDFRLWLMYMSPTEFKHRNLFVDPNSLLRI